MDSVVETANSLAEKLSEQKIVPQQKIDEGADGISLLALKNQCLASYINNTLLVALSQLEGNNSVRDAARERTVEQRVSLEKGIRPLEAKITYQVDKALRAFRRSVEQEEAKKQRRQEQESTKPDDESDSDVDPSAYRPQPQQLASRRSDSEDEDDADEPRKYVVPKISATLPNSEQTKSTRPRRRDFAMEEYVQDNDDAPVAEPSIGSRIMDSGRGGEQTSRDRRRNREVDDYEEANFTRISGTSKKQSRKDAAQRQRDAETRSFFGEDWGFLDTDGRGGSTGAKRQLKSRGKSSSKRRKH